MALEHDPEGQGNHYVFLRSTSNFDRSECEQDEPISDIGYIQTEFDEYNGDMDNVETELDECITDIGDT